MLYNFSRMAESPTTLDTVGRSVRAHTAAAGVFVGASPKRPSPLHDHVFHEDRVRRSRHGRARSRRGRDASAPAISSSSAHRCGMGLAGTAGLTIINCLFRNDTLAAVRRRAVGRRRRLRNFFRGASAARTGEEAPTVLHVRPGQRPVFVERLERIMAELAQPSQRLAGRRHGGIIGYSCDDGAAAAQNIFHARAVRLAVRTEQAVVLDTVTHLRRWTSSPCGWPTSRTASASAPLTCRGTSPGGWGWALLSSPTACGARKPAACSAGPPTPSAGSRRALATTRSRTSRVASARKIGQSPREYRRVLREEVLDVPPEPGCATFTLPRGRVMLSRMAGRAFNGPYTGDHLSHVAFPLGGIGGGWSASRERRALPRVAAPSPDVNHEPPCSRPS